MKQGETRLGTEVRDRISGFKGIAVAITTWFNGCERIAIQPRELKDGKRIEMDTFDCEDVEFVGEGLTAQPAYGATEKTGGPCNDRAAQRR